MQGNAESNPFRHSWLLRKMVHGHYCFPGNASVPKILTYFNTDAVKISTARNDISQAFISLWNVKKFESRGIELTDEFVIDGKIKIKISKVDKVLSYLTITEISGWLSKEHLNSMLKRNLHGSPNERQNDFLIAFRRDSLLQKSGSLLTLPDSTILATLYQTLGVQSFAELELGTADLEVLVKLCSRTKYNDIWETVDHDGRTIRALEVSEIRVSGDFERKLVFTDAPITNFVKQIEVILSTRRNPQGFKGGRDVFQRIVEGEIRGKELGRICISNKEMLKRCTDNDFGVFRNALRREFGIVWKPLLHGYANARDLYGRMHEGFFSFTPGNKQATYIKNGSTPQPESILVVPSMIGPKFHFDRDNWWNFLYNATNPSFSFVVNLSTGQLVGAEDLATFLGESYPKFRERLNSKLRPSGAESGARYHSGVVSEISGDEDLATFFVVRVR